MWLAQLGVGWRPTAVAAAVRRKAASMRPADRSKLPWRAVAPALPITTTHKSLPVLLHELVGELVGIQQLKHPGGQRAARCGISKTPCACNSPSSSAPGHGGNALHV